RRTANGAAPTGFMRSARIARYRPGIRRGPCSVSSGREGPALLEGPGSVETADADLVGGLLRQRPLAHQEDAVHVRAVAARLGGRLRAAHVQIEWLAADGAQDDF